MKNQRRILFGLGAMFFALLALVAFLNRPTTPNAPTTIDFATVFSDFTVDDIQAIRLEDPRNPRSFTLQRDEDAAWIAPENAGTLNLEIADLLAQTVTIIPYQRIIPLAENANMGDYGFTPSGRLLLQIVVRDGRQYGMIVGGRTPADSGYYALVDNRPELYILERGAIDFMISSLITPPVS
jgi:hypothetical protein